MKLLKSLMLFALIPLFYGCSENLLNEEDPTSALKAEQAASQSASTEFVKSDHIIGFLDAQAEILYIMPARQELALQRLGAARLADNQFEISTEHADGAQTRTKFSIVNVKERAMIYNLANVRANKEELVQVTADDEEPIENEEPKDYIIYEQAKCTKVWGKQKSPCTIINSPSSPDAPKSIKVFRWDYSTCQLGEDLCIEKKRSVRTVFEYKNKDCKGLLSFSHVMKMSCE